LQSQTVFDGADVGATVGAVTFDEDEPPHEMATAVMRPRTTLTRMLRDTNTAFSSFF